MPNETNQSGTPENITPENQQGGIDLDAQLQEQLEEIATPVDAADTPSQPSGEKAAEDASEETTTETKEQDPFSRISKKKVAKPQSMNTVMKGKVKKGRKISPKFFVIGCLVLFILFAGLATLFLYYIASSASTLKSLGLQMTDVKQILKIFAILFFGVTIMGGFYMLVLNIYRLVTVKGKKLKYGIGTFVGFLLMTVMGILMAVSIQRINAMQAEVKINTNLLVAPKLVIANGASPILNADSPKIAPMKVEWQLNSPLIDTYVFKQLKITPERVLSYELDCGNGQKSLEAGAQLYNRQNAGTFAGTCFYLDKQDYPVVLNVTYADSNNQRAQASFPVTTIEIDAEIELEGIDDKSYLNDDKTEYIVGISPVNVAFRAQKLFTDLGITQGSDRIEWDLDDDGQMDLIDNASFEHPLTTSGLHPISYRLPGLSGGREGVLFTFDLRVVESELARCELDLQEVDAAKRRWSFDMKFDEQIKPVTYHYTIYDVINDTKIADLKENASPIKYTFPAGGRYEVSASYFNREGQKGSCPAQELDVGFAGNQVSFDLRWKQKSSEPFLKTGEDTPVVHTPASARIDVSTIPAILELDITDIQPDPTAEVSLYFEGRQMFGENNDIFEINIGSVGEKELVFEITTKQGNVSEQKYVIDVDRSTLRANIEVEPDIVGEDPFEVTLDASVSDLYDEKDEIVYFTWDFGDGETKENVSQGKIKHTYRFDAEKNKGEYYPSVTVQTKLGQTDSYRLETPITVKRKQREVEISIDSHPTQQAKVDDVVQLSLGTDGNIKSIARDFGNQKSFDCEDRSCASIPVRYNEAGEYTIKAEVTYADESPVIGRIKLRVYE